MNPQPDLEDPAGEATVLVPDQLLRGFAMVLAGVGVGALTGAGFWLIAAHLHPSADVGRASGLFTSVLFVCFITGLGLPVAVSRFAGRPAPGSASLFTWSLVLSALVSAVGALLYLDLVDSPAVAVLDARGWLGRVLFAVIAVGGSLTLLVDVRLMAARRWGWLLARITAVGLGQLALLLAVGDRVSEAALWMFLAAAGPAALSGFAGVVLLPALVHQGYRLRPAPADARPMVRYATVNYVATLALEAPRFALPVIVLVNVTPTANANFYLAWGLVAVVLLVPTGLGQVLLVEASRSERPSRRQLAVAGLTGVGVMALTWIAALVASDVIPRLYGPDYRSAARLVPLLVAAGMPWSLTSVALADARVRNDHAGTLVITFGLSGLVLAPAALLVPRYGIDGVGLPWLVGNVVAAGIALAVLHRGRERYPSQVSVSSSTALATGTADDRTLPVPRR